MSEAVPVVVVPPPAAVLPQDRLHLVKPTNTKSKFWKHFHRYDANHHPDKTTTARCELCGKDISVKQGTGGLKNHMKFKHKHENAILLDEEYPPSPGPHSPLRAAVAAVANPAARKKPRHEVEVEKRSKEKHLMEMWSVTRKEIADLRKELKGESDEDAIQDLAKDIRLLRKRKADYEEQMGMNDDRVEL